MTPKPTVYAVMKVIIEIPVRGSGSEEKLCDLYEVAKREAENILRNKLTHEFRIIGSVEFSHAIVKEILK